MEELTYEKFIQNILETRGRFNCGEEYHERHHIVPKCCGGTNDKDNLIDLYAKEHFVAHRLLAIENPDNYGLVYAWGCMAWVTSDKQERYQLTPEEYAEIRERIGKAISEVAKERLSDPRNHPMFGKHFSEESRKKMSEHHRDMYGENNPNYGKELSTETCKKISKSVKSSYTEERKREISMRQKERLSDPRNHPLYGKHHSEETRRKISESKLKKPIINLDTKIIYKGQRDAQNDTGVDQASIWRCCNNKQKTAGGFRWMYKADYEAIINNENDADTHLIIQND